MQRAVRVLITQMDGSARTITPGCKLWCRWLDPPRDLVGAEKMSIQGMFPDMHDLGSLSNHQENVLAGNAYSTTVLAAVLMAVFVEFLEYL
eukprot:3607988-Pyramimonas_sp.AAC.1